MKAWKSLETKDDRRVKCAFAFVLDCTRAGGGVEPGAFFMPRRTLARRLTRCRPQPWYVSDVSAEVNLHILMSDFAISTMPANVTDFVVVSDSSSPPPPSPSFLIEMIKGLVKGYPDRLNKLYSAPMGGVLSTVMSLLLPMMPGALSSKIVLYQTKEEMHATLKDVLYGGENDIPDFFGGQCKHDDIFNGEQLDWKKMKEVHQACRDKFIEENGK